MTSPSEEVPLLGIEEEENDDSGVSTEDKVTTSPGQDKSEVQDFVYDVFISYSASDRPWVKDVLLQTLEQEGKRVCIDYRDLPPGVPVIDNLVHAIENSQVTVLVLTPAFVQSEWCTYESKQALVSSLNTSRGARVLPLILMECEIPNILTHLTYLDYGNEDVQPYFRERLTECLNSAEKWTSVSDLRRDIVPVSEVVNIMGSTCFPQPYINIFLLRSTDLRRDIVPVSEVEEIVARNLEQKKRNKEVFSKLKSSYRWFIFWKYVINLCPLLFLIVLFGISYLVTFNYFAKFPQKTILVHPRVFIATSSRVLTVFPVTFGVPGSLQSFSVTNKKSKQPVLFDAYAFDDVFYLENLLYIKRRATFLNASLSPKTFFKTEDLSIHGFMSLTARFCFRSPNSEENATLRLYKPKNPLEIAQLSPQTNNSTSGLIAGLNSTYDEYEAIANKTMCGSSEIEGLKVAANKSSFFAFYNSGNSTVLLKLSAHVAEISYRADLATHSCRGVTKCDISNSFSDIMNRKYIIMSTKPTLGPYEMNISRSYVDGNKYLVYHCIFFVLCIVIVGILVDTQIRSINRGANHRLRKWYFQRTKFYRHFGEFEIWALVISRSYKQLKSIIQKRLERRENLTFYV